MNQPCSMRFESDSYAKMTCEYRRKMHFLKKCCCQTKRISNFEFHMQNHEFMMNFSNVPKGTPRWRKEGECFAPHLFLRSCAERTQKTRAWEPDLAISGPIFQIFENFEKPGISKTIFKKNKVGLFTKILKRFLCKSDVSMS